MIIILLGPPGSGKGTQAEIICEKFNLQQISTGDILRKKINDNSPMAEEIKKIMKTGTLFSDEFVNDLVEKELTNVYNKNPNQGLLFDGYPRTIGQAVFLNSLFNKINKKIDCVLNFKIPDELIIDRVSARRIDRKTGKVYNLIFNPPPKDENLELYQRVDDNVEVIKKRLNIYYQQTSKLIDFYKNLNLIEVIDASYELEIIKQNVDNILNKFK